MSILKSIKNYFNTEEPETVVTLPNETEKWKALAIEVNRDVMAIRREYKAVVEECNRLTKLIEIYQEILERKDNEI